MMLPQMYGDPSGYTGTGSPAWYQYTENLFTDRLLEIYLWSMESQRPGTRARERAGSAFLEGKNPDYPVEALQADLVSIRRQVREMNADATTPDTRLADYLMTMESCRSPNLTNLTMGTHWAGTSGVCTAASVTSIRCDGVQACPRTSRHW